MTSTSVDWSSKPTGSNAGTSSLKQNVFLGGQLMHAHYQTDPAYPLYDARWEHDACGTGFVAQVSGEASHLLVQTALEALAHLTHRGEQDAGTSDGAGLLTQIPKALLCEELQKQNITVTHTDDLAVGMIFLPAQDRFPIANVQCRHLIE